MKREEIAHVPSQPSAQDVDDFVDGDLADEPAAGDIAVEEEPAELDDRSKQILAFEKRWWRQAGSKEQAIRDTFGLSATRYYQLLNVLLDNPLALAHEPVVVQRLRRLRVSRARRR
ncbi:DUF3263 domain-containing protein [Dactylosporangium sp. NPDC005572]|uniref:DUF3263 domain-containing protein n=1 Tax=Dactylosporangium sp. NPDC005572 TaxID=3156889 RepID=UPI0033B3DE97